MSEYDKQPSVSLAMDASEKLVDFINQITYTLASKGVPNAYTIANEIESAILEELYTLGKSTKITLDDLNMVLSRFGTPQTIAANYTGNTETDEINDHFAPTDVQFPMDKFVEAISRPFPAKLPKRKIGDDDSASLAIRQLISWIVLVSPFIFVGLGLMRFLQFGYSADVRFFYSGYSYDKFGFYLRWGITFFAIGILVFVAGELYSGAQGILLEKYRVVLTCRKLFRSVIFIGTQFWTIVYLLSIQWVNLFTGEEIILLVNYREGLEQIWFLWLSLWTLVELTVLARDHLAGLAPLQPKFPPKNEITNLGNILIAISFLAYFSFYSFIFIPWIVVFSGLAILYHFVKRKSKHFNLWIPLLLMHFYVSLIHLHLKFNLF